MSPNPAILTWPRAVAGGSPLEFLGYYASDLDAASYTFTDVPLGDPHADRTIILATHAHVGQGRYMLSASINGVAATPLYSRSGNSPLRFWRVAVPTGATGSVYFNTNAPKNYGGGIGVYRTTKTVSYVRGADASNSVTIQNDAGDYALFAYAAAASSSGFTITGPEASYAESVPAGLSLAGAMTDESGSVTFGCDTNAWTESLIAMSISLD